jgi:VWFA-related protein
LSPLLVSKSGGVRCLHFSWPGSDVAVSDPGRFRLGWRDATFRAGTQDVLVDAVVVDKKGIFQRDLTRQDFKLLEDGKEQKITSFSLEHGSAGAFEQALHRSGLRQRGTRIAEQVIQFVDCNASPDLYLAVFSRVNREMRLQQDFTSDADRIKAALGTM